MDSLNYVLSKRLATELLSNLRNFINVNENVPSTVLDTTTFEFCVGPMRHVKHAWQNEILWNLELKFYVPFTGV